MGSGCGNIIVDLRPSSSGQLPVPVALNAMLPTLFIHTIHQMGENVNPQFCLSYERRDEKAGTPLGVPVHITYYLPQKSLATSTMCSSHRP